MQVKSIAECFKGSILQLRSTLIKLPFVLKTFVMSFLNGRFTQVLQYFGKGAQCTISKSPVAFLTRRQGHKNMLMPNSTEHEVSTAHTCKNTKY